jgi:outer membrane lipoprotein carrier protein
MDFVKFSHRRRRPITSLVASLCFLSAGLVSAQTEQGAAADGASDLLDAFYAEVRDLAADFVQERFSAAGEPVEEPSTGRFTLLRPDRFIWHYAPPEEQIIVADGEWLWLYDVEFEQVEQRSLADLAASPALLLGGATPIRDSYQVSELPPAGGMRWLELTPLDPAADDFLTARLGFMDGVPVVVELVDGLGERTRVAFEGVEVNAGLAVDDFAFVPPSGVTVIGADD